MTKPWTNKLLFKFFLPYFSLSLTLLALSYFYAAGKIRTFYVSALAQEMLQEAKLLTRLLPRHLEGEAFDLICREMASDLDARLTVIDLEGKVLGDSEESSIAMENHAGRPEVAQARLNGTGESIRYSTTVKYEMLYQAVLMPDEHSARIVRIAVPLRQVEESANRIRTTMLAGLVAAFSLSFPFALFLFQRFGKRVQRIADFSQSVARGIFPKEPIPIRGQDELSIVERNLNEMSLSLQEKIKGITDEKEKVESILRCMMEGVVVLDPQGRVMLINQNAREMFDLPPDSSFYGAAMIEVSRHVEMSQLMQQVLARDSSTEALSKEIALDGKKWFRVNAVRLKAGDGKLLGHIMVFHDVTEVKRLETVRADFVANVSHELRTPLSAIKGYVETLLHNPPKTPETAHQFLEVVDRHSERLGRLIDDLLTLSDLESGKAQLAREPVEVDHLLRRVLEIFHDQAKKKGISLDHEMDVDLPRISGDPDRLQQLLINLVDNALKYTPSNGHVQVKAQLSGVPNGKDSALVEIAVSDTGCGIPAKDIPRLTERFYRVDKARSRELGGTGLGLAIVKHIVQAHGGYLKIESQLQKGTTLRIYLPSASSQRFKEVLFLCTGNSCRSQMAEGFARSFAPKEIAIFSAGRHPTRVHPLAVQVMREVGIDISDQRSKGIDEVPFDKADLVVSLCAEGAESCPALPGKVERRHWPLPDPALARGDEHQVIEKFREVRDHIRFRVEDLFRSPEA
jgi:two-component system phosphate regulon sensor histidine kinase PhoR